MNTDDHQTPEEFCADCSHRPVGAPGDWCYMFQRAPDRLPCTQHDKFAPERAAMASLLKKNPAILTAMVIAAMMDS